MSSLPSYVLDFDKEHMEWLRIVGRTALDISKRHYSSGYPHYHEGVIRKLGFNNARHCEVVGNDAARLARYVGLSDSEQALARLTGYAHDIVQLKGRGTDEGESAAWVKWQLLQNKTFSPRAAELASKTIIATEPLFHHGIITQKVEYMEFDSPRSQLFACCIVSADLSELYTSASPYFSHKLYAQRLGYEADEEPPFDPVDLLAFQQKNIVLLERYHYPLYAAEKLFSKYRAQVINYNILVATQLESGRITSWRQLIDQDLAFMRHPSSSFTKLNSSI